MKINIGKKRNDLTELQFLFNHLEDRPKLFKAIYGVRYFRELNREPDAQIAKQFYSVPDEIIEYCNLGSSGESLWENYQENLFFNNLFAVGKKQIDYIQYGYIVGTINPMHSNGMMSSNTNEGYSIWVHVYFKHR